LDTIIKGANAGMTVSAWENELLQNALDSLFMDLGKESRATRKKRSEEYVKVHFNIEKLLDSIIKDSGI
jgi:hypothetical protein